MGDPIIPMNNTRFNPTVNGSLHLGHLYLALINEHEAHDSGGKFYVRFDDAQGVYTFGYGKSQIADWEEGMKRDLDQYMKVDFYTSEADYWMALHQRPAIFRTTVERGTLFFYKPIPVTKYDGELYPYTPHNTQKKVYLDALEGITHLIRGDDLITEFSLYEYFRDLAGIPQVEHIYIPRLRISDLPLAPSMSKTFGTYGIASVTRKYGRDDVIDILRRSCLEDPDKPFAYLNIKEKPSLVI